MILKKLFEFWFTDIPPDLTELQRDNYKDVRIKQFLNKEISYCGKVGNVTHDKVILNHQVKACYRGNNIIIDIWFYILKSNFQFDYLSINTNEIIKGEGVIEHLSCQPPNKYDEWQLNRYFCYFDIIPKSMQHGNSCQIIASDFNLEEIRPDTAKLTNNENKRGCITSLVFIVVAIVLLIMYQN